MRADARASIALQRVLRGSVAGETPEHVVAAAPEHPDGLLVTAVRCLHVPAHAARANALQLRVTVASGGKDRNLKLWRR